ncbi:MAG: prepilin peptidase [Planctomycetes bacterium]|nr:prepilin peptidase [Planctomycetota bacterium]
MLQPPVVFVSQASLIFGAFAALFGLSVGSFINVVAHRLPKGGLRSLLGRSQCPRCERPIAWFDNIPILSWLALRARCRNCQLPISARYPIVESIGGILFLAAWAAQFWGRGNPEYTPRLVFEWCVLSSLLALSLIDLDLRELPDELTYSGMLLGPIAVAVLPEILANTWSYQKFTAEAWPGFLRALITSMIGLAVGAGTIAAIRSVGTALYSKNRDIAVEKENANERIDHFLCRQKPRHSKEQVHLWFEERLVSRIVDGKVEHLQKEQASLRLAGNEIIRIRIVKEAMGFGDVKLQGAVGAVVGAEGSFLVLGIASFAGAILGTANLLRIFFLLKFRAAARKRSRSTEAWQVARAVGGVLPFGPFLAIGAAVVLLARQPIVNLLFKLW